MFQDISLQILQLYPCSVNLEASVRSAAQFFGHGYADLIEAGLNEGAVGYVRRSMGFLVSP
jgi:hypothetical protein